MQTIEAIERASGGRAGNRTFRRAVAPGHLHLCAADMQVIALHHHGDCRAVAGCHTTDDSLEAYLDELGLGEARIAALALPSQGSNACGSSRDCRGAALLRPALPQAAIAACNGACTRYVHRERQLAIRSLPPRLVNCRLEKTAEASAPAGAIRVQLEC